MRVRATTSFRSVNVMWSVAALFQITRFLSNYVVLRHKLQTPPL